MQSISFSDYKISFPKVEGKNKLFEKGLEMFK
jgi:hypothetical protein